MCRVPESSPEGPGFEGLQELVGGSVLIQPQCRNLGNFLHLISPALSKPRRRLWSIRTTCGGAKNLWINKSCLKRVSTLKTATYKVRTVLRDEQIEELEEELRETRLVGDVIGIGEPRRREECFTTLQSGHRQFRSRANNGQAGVCFFINRKYASTISYSAEDINI